MPRNLTPWDEPNKPETEDVTEGVYKAMDHALWEGTSKSSLWRGRWRSARLNVLEDRRVLRVYCEEILLLDNGDVVVVEDYSLVGESGGGYNVEVAEGVLRDEVAYWLSILERGES